MSEHAREQEVAREGPVRPPWASLELLCAMPATIIRHQFTRGLHQGRVTRAQLDRPSVRRRIREAASPELDAVHGELHLVLKRPHLFLAWFSGDCVRPAA